MGDDLAWDTGRTWAGFHGTVLHDILYTLCSAVIDMVLRVFPA